MLLISPFQRRGTLCRVSSGCKGKSTVELLLADKLLCDLSLYFCSSVIFRRNRFCSVSNSACTYAFLRIWPVCLSSVCHVGALSLNRSTDLDAIWQVHLWGPMTHTALGTPGKGRFGGQTLSQDMQLQLAAKPWVLLATWQIRTRSWVDLPNYFGRCLLCDMT